MRCSKTLMRNELLSYKKATGFTLGQMEKDYVQHLFLIQLYRRVSDDLVFKGGTSLQKTHGLNRFSEDLDFTLVKQMKLPSVVDQTLTGMKAYGCEAIWKKVKEDKNGITYQIRAQGPLYTGTEKSLTYITMEISKRENVVLPVEMTTVVPIYKDLPSYLLPAMNPSEIMAEKIRALTTRQRARDLYDLYFLIKKGITTSPDLIDTKLSYYKKRFETDAFSQAVNTLENLWETELKPLVVILPRFDEVKKTVHTLEFIH
jgi:predicted nucleotidyltransferase component of viral defense system